MIVGARTVFLPGAGLTPIGIMLGHWLFGAPFTATPVAPSDLARCRCHSVQANSFDGACSDDRCRNNLDRPNLSGTRDFLLGLASSTLLTVLVIPAIYIVMRDDGRYVGI